MREVPGREKAAAPFRGGGFFHLFYLFGLFDPYSILTV